MTAFESHARMFFPLYVTGAAIVAFSVVSELLGNSLGFASVFLEIGVFCLICLFGCAIAPQYPLRVVFFCIAGAFIGIIIDLIAHPTLDGYERNLWPIEIVLHTAIAAVCCVATAGAWKVVCLLLTKRKEHA